MFFLLFGTQCKTIVEPEGSATYVYINKAKQTVIMYVFNRDNAQSSVFTLAQSDSVFFEVTNSPGPSPFGSAESDAIVSDSVVLRFVSEQCTYYTRKNRQGIFSHLQYEEVKENPKYLHEGVHHRLTYLIDVSDLTLAESCK